MRLPQWLTRLFVKRPRAFAQGDVLMLPVENPEGLRPPEEQVVLAEGEHTGHRHAFYGGARLYRDRARPDDILSALYIGHIDVAAGGAVLEHGPGPGRSGDHDPVKIPAGTYVALRQREYTDPEPHTFDFRTVID